jgi:hypothetical protein
MTQEEQKAQNIDWLVWRLTNLVSTLNSMFKRQREKELYKTTMPKRLWKMAYCGLTPSQKAFEFSNKN